MKRMLIGLILGTLLALNVVSVAAARFISLEQMDSELYPDVNYVALTATDTASRQSARLLAIDSVFYPDSLGAGVWEMPDLMDLGYTVAAADWYFDCE